MIFTDSLMFFIVLSAGLVLGFMGIGLTAQAIPAEVPRRSVRLPAGLFLFFSGVAIVVSTTQGSIDLAMRLIA